MLEKTKKFCDTFLSMGIPGFDLAVYKDGECILRYINGYSDLENKIPMNGKEKYYIYSCSKPITCTAALQLYEKGLFSLDDRLSDYMPEFAEMTVRSEDGIKKAENPILIKHLFEMTSGFSYERFTPNFEQCKKDTDDKCPTREVMKYLAKDPLSFEPGDRWQYGLSHDVLAALIEVITGETFEDYLKENIFIPLGMTDTTFNVTDSVRMQIAPQYAYSKAKGGIYNFGKGNDYIVGSDYLSGGAGCVSTVDDYMKFLEGLRTYRLLKKETVDLMREDRLSDWQRRTYVIKDTHGYGLGMRTHKKGGIFTELGWGGAAGAYLSVEFEHGISLYFAQHVIDAPNQPLRERLNSFILAELFDNADHKKRIENITIGKDYKYTF